MTIRLLLEEAARTGRLTVRYADAELDARAWDLMERYADLRLSFTDCVGACSSLTASRETTFRVLLVRFRNGPLTFGLLSPGDPGAAA